MSFGYFEAIRARRSVYALGEDATVSDERIEELLGEALMHSPSAFNGQAGRILLLLGGSHDEFWEATLGILKPRVEAGKFPKTEVKLAGFKAAHGTVLFFEDREVIEGLQARFPAFRDSFDTWSGNAAGMLQHVVWTALAAEGMGASLQHYNPLVDSWVRERFGLPASWSLTAEMPFGRIAVPAGPKEFRPLEGRLMIAR